MPKKVGVVSTGCAWEWKIPIAAKKKGGGSSLSEEEREVIDLARVEAAMQAAITALKWEYSNTLVTRLTPGTLHVI